MNKIFTLLLLFLAVCTNAQTTIPEIEWEKSLGSESNDSASGITVTADGGYITFGYIFQPTGTVTTHYGASDYWIAKLDALGNLEWEKTYGGSLFEWTSSAGLRIDTFKIRQTPDGGYILGANSSSTDGDISANIGEADVWLVKIDSVGNIEWEKSYGTEDNDAFLDIKVTNDGGFIMTNGTSDSTTNVYGSKVTKLDALGNIEWTTSYGEAVSAFSHLMSIIQTSDGGYISTGWTSAPASETTPTHEIFPGFNDPNSRLWVLKMDASGVFEWAKAYGGSSIEEGYSIVETADGNFVVAGMTISGDGDAVGHPDPDTSTSQWVLKLDSTGEILWQKTYGVLGNAVDIKITPDGNYVIGGSYISYIKSTNGEVINGRGGTDEFLMKVNQENGDIIWTKTMGGSAQDNLWAFALTPEGGFITIGSSRSTDGDISGNIAGFDHWVVKLGPDCVVPDLTAEKAYTVCSDTEFTLSATSEGNTINWYESEKSMDILFTGEDFVIPSLTAGTSYWVGAVSPTGCYSPRIEVVVTVNARPDLTVEDTTVSICENTDITLSASTSAGNTIAWYSSADATESIASGTEFTTPSLTETTSYWVESFNAVTNCPSQRTEVVVTVLPLPVLTVDTTAVTICEDTEAVLTAETNSGNTIVWYDSADATESVAAGTEFTTPNLTETISYWVEALNPLTNCASERLEVVITVSPVSQAVVEFSYTSSVCILDNNPVPVTVDGFTQGGTFSAEGLSIDPLTGVINLASSKAGTYTVTYTVETVGCLSGASDSTVIVITDSVTPVVSFNYSDICTNETFVKPVLDNSFSSNGTFSSTSGLTIDEKTGEINVKMSQPGSYTVVYEIEEDLNSCSAFARFEFEVVISVCQIQRGISPNGDTLNDWFDLTGVGVSHLGIFNRYGKEVYTQSNYVKEWGGQDKNGNELPDGTYYYAIEKTNGEKLTGWIYINRNH